MQLEESLKEKDRVMGYRDSRDSKHHRNVTAHVYNRDPPLLGLDYE